MLPDGVDELLPAQAWSLESARREALDVFVSSGFNLIHPPLIEFEESLLIGLGDDVASQSMRLTDQLSGRLMALRADVSSQAARIDAHVMQGDGINRLCYVEPVVHARPKSQWSSRCPLMAGAEIFGSNSLAADIEVILLMLTTVKRLEATLCPEKSEGFSRLTLDLGHVAIVKSVFDVLKAGGCDEDTVNEIRSALQRKSIPDLAQLVNLRIGDLAHQKLVLALPELCGDIDLLDTAADALQPVMDVIAPVASDLKRIVAVVKQCFPEVEIYCDLAEGRGYEYHTGVVFALYSDLAGFALANGGRYDGVGEVFGRRRYATGFNTDLKVLRRLFESSQSLSAQGNQSSVIATSMRHVESTDSPEQLASFWQRVSELRHKEQVVVLVDDSSLQDYSRILDLQDGQWKILEH